MTMFSDSDRVGVRVSPSSQSQRRHQERTRMDDLCHLSRIEAPSSHLEGATAPTESHGTATGRERNHATLPNPIAVSAPNVETHPTSTPETMGRAPLFYLPRRLKTFDNSHPNSANTRNLIFTPCLRLAYLVTVSSSHSGESIPFLLSFSPFLYEMPPRLTRRFREKKNPFGNGYD